MKFEFFSVPSLPSFLTWIVFVFGLNVVVGRVGKLCLSWITLLVLTLHSLKN